MCSIIGCDTFSRYKLDDVCQKHYFRMRRTGSYRLSGKKLKNGERKPVLDASGYVLVLNKECPISRKSGLILEHRLIVYGVYGDNMPSCDFCGKRSSWDSRSSHVDHINEIKSDNRPENLRVLCNGCNTRRTKRSEHKYKGNYSAEWMGEVKTPEEWGRDERIPIQGSTIRQRLNRGLSVEDAFFSKKATHKNKPKKELVKII